MKKRLSIAVKKLLESLARKLWARITLFAVISLLIATATWWITGFPHLNALIDADIANGFLGTVAQILAGILAIVFSISVLAIDISADKYTSQIFSFFSKDKITWTTFGVVLLCILISTIAMGIQTMPMRQWGFLATSSAFTFCLLITLDYFRWVLWLLDPKNLAHLIRDEGIQAVQKDTEDNQDKLLNAVTSLGDVAIKALSREENAVVQVYIDALQAIQKAAIEAGKPLLSSEIGKITWSASGYGIASPVVEQYYRVFKIAIDKNAEEIIWQISSLIYEIIYLLLQREDNEYGLSKILEQYQIFFKFALERKEFCRFGLARNLRRFVFPNTCSHNFVDKYLPHCLSTLYQINQEIIAQQDFDLWRELVDHFSSAISIKSNNSRLINLLSNKLRIGLMELGYQKPQEWVIELTKLLWQTREWLTPNSKYLLELWLTRIEQTMPNEKQELKSQIQEIREIINELWVSQKIDNKFFKNCVNALHNNQVNFVKKLWDTELFYKNIEFLNHQTVQVLSSIDFNNTEAYILRYYLLCLAYTLQQTDWDTTNPRFGIRYLPQDTEFMIEFYKCSKSNYYFFMNLSDYADKALEQYEATLAIAHRWDDVFEGETIKALKIAKELLESEENRAKWQKTADKWKAIADNIVEEMPLDDRRVQICKDKARTYHRSESLIAQLVTITDQVSQKQVETIKSHCRLQLCAAREEFTSLAYKPEEAVGDDAKADVVHQILRQEMHYVLTNLLENSGLHPLETEYLSYDQVTETVKTMRKAEYKPEVLIIPMQHFKSSSDNDVFFKLNIIYKEGQSYLSIDEKTSLKIIHFGRDYAFILDKKAGNWVTISPLEVTITEHPKDPLKVQITAQETVAYQVVNPEAAAIYDLSSESEPSQSKHLKQQSEVSKDVSHKDIQPTRRIWGKIRWLLDRVT